MFETNKCSMLLKKTDLVNQKQLKHIKTTADNQLCSICKYHNINYDLRLSECFLFSNISPLRVGGNII